MLKKFVLDTCVVKDLLKYHKNKEPKNKNGVNIEKLYNYMKEMKFDEVSKCYLTIYTFYEILKDFKSDFSKDVFEFYNLLCPQVVTSPEIRKEFDDYDLINLHLKSRNEQERVLSNLRNLIAGKIAGFMTEIFMTMLNIFICLLSISLGNDNAREKQIKTTLWNINTTIYNSLFEGVRINVEESKRYVVDFLDNEYKKFMKLVVLFLQELENKTKVSYKNINKLLIKLNETLKNYDYKNKNFNESYDMFQFFYKWFKTYYTEKYPQITENDVKKEYKDLIKNLVKRVWPPLEKDVMNEYFYGNIEKLFFRVFEPTQVKNKRRDATYGFGFDINDIIDMYILRLCFKGKYLKEDLLVLTSDGEMKKRIDKFFPSSKILYKEFGSAKS